jgi:hypothetical protein
MFSGLSSAVFAAIALKLYALLYIYDLQIKFEDGCYRPILGRVMPHELSIVGDFYSFPYFSPTMCAAVALILCTWLYIFDLQIKFKDGCYRPIFGRFIPLELIYFNGFYSFTDLFLQCAQLLH